MLVIAEKINGTRKLVNKAVMERDVAFIQNLARSQADAGADYLDINAGTLPDREPDDVVWLVNIVQEVVDKPLCLDSANPHALLAGLAVCKQPPIINSISAEENRLRDVMPVVAKHGLKTLALAIDPNGIPETGEGRLTIIRRLFEETRKAGIPDENMYVDPLVMSVATVDGAGNITLETMRQVKREFPEAHLTGGLSNISFGLPGRTLINRAFLTLAIDAGLDSAIMDPTDRGLMETLYATNAVLGIDAYCGAYSRAFRKGIIGTKPAAKTPAPVQ
jgi:5-methyltetrahydrofolate--homocysteine methyltransferase